MERSKEITFIKKAARIAEKGMRAAKLSLRSGITERMLAAKIELAMRKAGADWFAFPTIVTAGPNCKDIHHIPGERKIRARDLVIVDIGAVYKGYRSDMSRTFCLRPGKREKKLYSVVKTAQELAIKEIKPRVKCYYIDKIARTIIKDAGYTKKQFPHGTGHGVGKKIHEKPSFKPRSRDKLKKNQVVTVEPGIYLKWGGVRIEDMILVTRKGHKTITNFPKNL